MDKSIFYYDLPPELIAQSPLKDRSASRLLVLERNTGKITHMSFSDVYGFLNKGDCLVLNDTKVIPARLMGVKETGAQAEVLLLKRHADCEWEALVKPGRRIKEGDTLIFGDGVLRAFVKGVLDDGVRLLEFSYDGVFEEILDSLGETPLPPYITKKLDDNSRYQTVYAENAGSAAAPTAGLHFTPELLKKISDKGIKTAKITLHVGLGTFRPIKTDNLLNHKMHKEFFKIDGVSEELINDTKRAGGRIICVGTTSVRCVESACCDKGVLRRGEGSTSIFIYPGYNFKITDGIITNFHLPESTLLALVSAFAGTDRVMAAYKEAVSEGYRFFSFGDCCLIL